MWQTRVGQVLATVILSRALSYLQRSSRWIIGSYALSSLPTNAFFLNEFPDLMQIEL